MSIMTYAELKKIIEDMTPEQQMKEVLIATEFAMSEGDVTAGKGYNVEDAENTVFGEDETDIDSDHPVIVATTEGL